MLVLFVCTGNTCRSPMAEAIGRALFAKHRIEVRSAGVHAGMDCPASQLAQEAICELELSLEAHRSQPLTRELTVQATVVLTMTRAQAAEVQALCPTSGELPRVSTLHEFATGLEGDIPDPFGGELDEYRDTRDAIAELLTLAEVRLLSLRE